MLNFPAVARAPRATVRGAGGGDGFTVGGRFQHRQQRRRLGQQLGRGLRQRRHDPRARDRHQRHSIPALLSDGEFVVNTAATQQNRELLETINAGRLSGFADGGLANLRVPEIPDLAGMRARAPAAPSI